MGERMASNERKEWRTKRRETTEREGQRGMRRRMRRRRVVAEIIKK